MEMKTPAKEARSEKDRHASEADAPTRLPLVASEIATIS